MAEDEKEREATPQLSKSQKVVQSTMKESALAMELPFTIVGAILLAGFLGYLGDRWLHTKPWLMIVGGAFGFASSLFDIARRYGPK
jgi:F0F1-type ATP synthase assembly protein I